MLARTLIAAVLFGMSPAIAAGTPGDAPAETRIRNMSRYLETVVDPQRGVFIRGETGQWYYARVMDDCARLNRNASLRFETSPSGVFDRNSSLRADGWRCMVSSVVESDGPPRRTRH